MLGSAVTACSSDSADESERLIVDPIVVIDAAAEETLGLTPRDVDVVLAEPIAENTVEVFGAGRSTPVTGTDVATRAYQGASALLTALDAEGRATASAVSVDVPGLDATPVNIDYTSTAFSHLLFYPSFVTDDPLEIALLRGVAEAQPAFRELAAAIEENARNNPGFDSEPTAAEGEAMADLVEQVQAELDRLVQIATEVIDAPSNARPVTGFARQQAPMAPGLPTGEILVDADGCLVVATETKDGLCLKPSAEDDDLLVTIENTSYSWSFLFAYPVSFDEPRFAGIASPKVFGLPSLTTIAAAFAKVGVSVSPQGRLGKWACSGLSKLGGSCPDEIEEFLDPIKAMEALRNDLNPSSDGEGTAYIYDRERNLPLTAVTGGYASSDDSKVPYQLAAETRDPYVAAAGLLNLITHVFSPGLNVLTGTRALTNESFLAAAAPEKGDMADGLASEFLGLVAGNPAIAGGVLEIARHFEEGEKVEALKALGDLLYDLAFNPDFLIALASTYGAEDTIALVLQGLVKKLGSAVVPGFGWVQLAATAADTLSLVVGAYYFTEGLPDVAEVNSYGPIEVKTATEIVKGIDPYNRTYDFYYDIDFAVDAESDPAGVLGEAAGIPVAASRGRITVEDGTGVTVIAGREFEAEVVSTHKSSLFSLDEPVVGTVLVVSERIDGPDNDLRSAQYHWTGRGADYTEADVAVALESLDNSYAAEWRSPEEYPSEVPLWMRRVQFVGGETGALPPAEAIYDLLEETPGEALDFPDGAQLWAARVTPASIGGLFQGTTIIKREWTLPGWTCEPNASDLSPCFGPRS